MITSKDKVEFLMKEKEIAREEILMNIKTINSILFSFLTIFIGFLSFYFSGKGYIENDKKVLHYIVILAQQLEFIIVIFSLSIHSNIFSLAGYIR